MKFLDLQIRKMIISLVEVAIVYLFPWSINYNTTNAIWEIRGCLYAIGSTLSGLGLGIQNLSAGLEATPTGIFSLLLVLCPIIAIFPPVIEGYCLKKMRWLYHSKSRPRLEKKEFKAILDELRDWSVWSVVLAAINGLIIYYTFGFFFAHSSPTTDLVYLVIWIVHIVFHRKRLRESPQSETDLFPTLPQSEGKAIIAAKTEVHATPTIATAESEVAWRAPTASHVSEVERVSVWRHATYQAGRVRLETRITNTSDVAVWRVQISLFLGKAFRVLRIEPSTYEREKLAVRVGEILPNGEKHLVWILEPLLSGKQSVDGSVTGVDTGGAIFVKALDPLEVKVECPTFVPPVEATLPALKQLVETLPANSERIYYLPIEVSTSLALSAAIKLFTSRNLRHVGTFTLEEGGDPGFDRTAYFYALSKEGGKRYVITASVSEQNHVIRVYAACEEEEGCMGFMTEAGSIIRQELVAEGVVDAESAILELVCERCGIPLPRGPSSQDDGVQCIQCKRIWYLKDLL